MRYASREVLGHEPSRETLMAGVGQPLPRQMEAITDGVSPELTERMLSVYTEHNEAHHDDLIREFPGVPISLRRLREAGISLAVVTSKRRPAVEMALRCFPEIGEGIDLFVTMEDTEEHKPGPQPLLKALELLGGVPREEVTYVGDSPYDVLAARAAGIPSLGLSWGVFDGESIAAEGPDYLVGDLDAATNLLLRLRSE